MSLVAFDGMPLISIGGAGRLGIIGLPNNMISFGLAATNAAFIMIGQIWTEDGASHVINTTGSSSLGWKASAGVFANSATRVKVGLASVDMANGPPARAVNASGVITFNVSKTCIGGTAAWTQSAWNEAVPDTGSMTIANGDLVAFAFQTTVYAGADTVNIEGVPVPITAPRSLLTQFDGTSTYIQASYMPNGVITFADGKLGFIVGSFVASNARTDLTWNNTSGTKEYGNYLKMPVPCRIYGVVVGANWNADADVILYSDPLGTPVAQRTVSMDANVTNFVATSGTTQLLFATPYSAAANEPLAAIVKPTTSSSITMQYKTVNAANHMKSEQLGMNGYAISRNTGAFSVQNSNKDLYSIGWLVGAFDSTAVFDVNVISANTIARGTVGSGASTTSVPTSAFTPAGAAADQFAGRWILFDATTTTAGLRGCSRAITASSNAATPTLTVNTLSATPVSGDTFSVV